MSIRTGTLAAARGGFAHVCPMPNLDPVPDSREHLEAQLAIIRRDAAVRVHPYGAITRGEQGEALADLADNNAYWAGWEGPVRTVGEAVYDSFLRSYGQDLGMQSYGACVDLLVEYFLPLCGPTE